MHALGRVYVGWLYGTIMLEVAEKSKYVVSIKYCFLCQDDGDIIFHDIAVSAYLASRI